MLASSACLPATSRCPPLAPQGLAFLHASNVLHLDIKPDNIYLSAASGLPDGAVASPGAVAGWATCRIGDFGLAVAREQNGSMVSCVPGNALWPVHPVAGLAAAWEAWQ